MPNDSLQPIDGGNIPIDQNVVTGGISDTGSFVEVTTNTMNGLHTEASVNFYLNANEIKIPPGLSHHRIILNDTNHIHFCKQIQNTINYEGMWYDNVSEELYKNAITYYYILCPNKRYNEDNDGISYNCRKDEVGLLSYSYINKYYDENNQQWDYGWGPNKYWDTIDSDTSTTQTGLLDTNVPYYEGFEENEETEDSNNRNVSTVINRGNLSSYSLTISYNTFKVIYAKGPKK